MSGIFNISKLYNSFSTCGPSAIVYHIEIKISSNKFEAIEFGCLCHLHLLQNSAVTSIFSVSFISSYFLFSISLFFFSISSIIKSFNSLAKGQISFFSSTLKSLIHLRKFVKTQFFHKNSFSKFSVSFKVEASTILTLKTSFNSFSLIFILLFKV
ncbi:MAG: hypothetical protein LBQ59_03020 [Candidatus Peribacteria bacterium]|nr:hypothetical protein [Candidatus Peribacteria bacterium]